MRTFAFISLLFPLLIAACGGDDDGGGSTGTVQVFVEAEDTIPGGLDPGTGEENVKDGWTIRYDKFIVVVGDFKAHRSAAPDDVLALPDTWVLDMKNLPAGGFVLGEKTGVAAERWDKVGYSLPKATSAAKKADFTAQADYDLMVQNGWSIYVEATLTKPDGQSCLPTAPTDCVAATTVHVKFGLDAATSFADCAPPQGDAGFAVPSGGSVQVKPTIHGDHWFFSNITQGAEITDRLAQWIANADLNRDGNVDLAEAGMSTAGDLFPSPPYNLSGAIIPIDNGADYIEAQSRTLGDFEGEGECPTRTIL
jgi:hypothetical protein